MPLRRTNMATNQPDLFESESNVVSLGSAMSRLYGWYTFDADPKGKLIHACIGAPDAQGESWLAHINILKEARRYGGEPQQPDQPPDLPLGFQDHVEEMLRKRHESEEREGRRHEKE